MSVQDRNIDRFAEFVRRIIQGEVITAAGTNEDEIQLIYTPQFNYRLVDLQVTAAVVATTLTRVRACIAKAFSAIGAPQFGAAAAVTFTIEAFTQLDVGVFTAKGSTAAQAFGNVAQVADGFWGAWLIQIDGAQVVTTKPASLSMAFLTEEDAIKNAPAPDALQGVVGVLTLEAVGGAFIAGTTNTNAALVNSFNTVDRGGLFADLAVLATDQTVQSALSPSRLRVAGVGNLVGAVGDPVVITGRRSGVSTLTRALALASVRPFPLQGNLPLTWRAERLA